LLRLNAKTGDLEPFLGGISAGFVKFSKNGQSMAYVTYPDGVLWKANQDGSHPVRLTDPPMSASLPRWSPDGSQILFESADGDRSEIYLVSSQGDSPQRLLPESKESMGDADWSADGSQIVFDVPPAWDPKAEIRIFDIKTHHVSTVPGSLQLFSPRWSPDGRYIAAVSSLDNKSLSIFDVKTQQWSKRLENFVVEFQEWSKDSKFIYFSGNPAHGDVGLYRIQLSGGRPELLRGLKGIPLANAGMESGGIDFSEAPLIVRDTSIDDIYALTLEEK
jgi:Tol biopolymer transport system component